tara:strand:+ start:1150 stop:2022 length:873 start_codon:yes stop_codon:yes gene_type:complete
MSDPFSRAWDAAGDQWNAWFRSGGGGGGSQEFGGLSAEDREFKKMLYDQFRELPDEYEAYTGDRFADRSPEELALLQEMQEGAMYDKASQDLGFASDIYKKGAQYGVDELQSDAEKFMTSDLYRNEVRDQILRDMNRGASMSGMDLNASALGSFAGGTHSRGGTSGTQRLLQNQNYMSQAGDALTKLNFGAYQDALNRAGQLRQARETSAGRYGQTALQNLGIGQQGVASRYGAFRDERGDRQRDLDLAYKNWLDEKNFDIKKLGLGSQLFANMPMEEKVVTQQPASGGK